MCLQLGSTSSERSRTSYARGFIQLFLRYWLDSKVSGEKKPNIAHTALLNTVQRTCINYHGHQKPKVTKNLRTFYFLSKLAIHFSVYIHTYIHTYIVYIYTHIHIYVCVCIHIQTVPVIIPALLTTGQQQLKLTIESQNSLG